MYKLFVAHYMDFNDNWRNEFFIVESDIEDVFTFLKELHIESCVSVSEVIVVSGGSGEVLYDAVARCGFDLRSHMAYGLSIDFSVLYYLSYGRCNCNGND